MQVIIEKMQVINIAMIIFYCKNRRGFWNFVATNATKLEIKCNKKLQRSLCSFLNDQGLL